MPMNPILKLFVFFSFFLSTATISAQDCEVKDVSDWEKVTVVILEETARESKHQVAGEWRLKMGKRRRKRLQTIHDLPHRKLKKIKKHVASKGYCTVYIDLNNLYGLDAGVFYYWL